MAAPIALMVQMRLIAQVSVLDQYPKGALVKGLLVFTVTFILQRIAWKAT